MNQEELFQSIHIDLVHKASDPVKYQLEIANIAALVYKAREFELFEGKDIEFTLDNNERLEFSLDNKRLQFVTKDGKLVTDVLQQVVAVYLHYLLWKFPNNNIKPLLNLYNVPPENMELVAWYILVIFVQVNKTIGDLFRGEVELDKNYLSYILTASNHLLKVDLNMEEYLNTKYYFSDIVINFK